MVQIVYRKEGFDPTNASFLVIGFLHCLVSSGLGAILLTLALPGLRTRTGTAGSERSCCSKP